ncbi:MAG: DUF4157 domain-containing protein [Kofleriaceae bacterium]
MAHGTREKLHRKQHDEEFARAIERTRDQLQHRVGAATLVQASNAKQNPALFTEALRVLKIGAATLREAFATGDFDRALDATASIDAHLASARGHVGTRAAELASIEKELVATLALAPRIERDAVDAAITGDWAAWNNQRSTWITNTQVQRKAVEAAKPTTALPAIASSGVRSASSTLPYHQEIQRSFGTHSIANVRAEIGGPAVKAARLLGAKAYTVGEKIAFATAPDLHTAAHEAAHVIQQRFGLELPDGIDRAGDEHEQAADAVADAVVAGKSASHLLDRYAGSRAPTLAVQRKSLAQLMTVAAWEYVKIHSSSIETALGKELGDTIDATKLERSRIDSHRAQLQFPIALAAVLAGRPFFDQVEDLLAPVEVRTIVDTYRPLSSGIAGQTENNQEPEGPISWSPGVAVALAGQARRVIEDSLHRMVSRYEAQIDYQRGRVTVENLVVGHPFDRVLALVLCAPDVIDVRPKSSRTKSSEKKFDASHRYGTRTLSMYKWLGEQDPKLWNWIEVVDPADATVEDVAATLTYEANTAIASQIVVARPFFRIPPEYARTMLPAGADTGGDGLDDAHALASSTVRTEKGASFATEAAIAQSPIQPKQKIDQATMLATAGDVLRRLERLKNLIAPYGLWELLLPAIQWAQTQRDSLPSIPQSRLPGISSALAHQADILASVVGEVTRLVGPTPDQKPPGQETIRVIRKYAVAAGESHLALSAKEQQQQADAARDELAIRILEQQLRAHDVATRSLLETDSEAHATTEEQTAHAGFVQDVAAVRKTYERTGQVKGGELESLTARLDERMFEAGLKELQWSIQALAQMCLEARADLYEQAAALMEREFRTLATALGQLAIDLEDQVATPLRADRKNDSSRDADARVAASVERVARARKDRDAFVAEHQIAATLRRASDLLARQAFRVAMIKVVKEIAIQIGVAIAIGNVAAAAGAIAEEILLARAAGSVEEISSMVNTARIAGAVTNIVTDAALNTGFQVVTEGTDGIGEKAVENLASIGLSHVALAPFHNALAMMQTSERELATIERAWRAVKAGGLVTASMVTAMATNYAVHRAVQEARGRQPESKDVFDWIVEGGSMAIGHFVSGRAHNLLAELSTSKLGSLATRKQLAAVEALATKAAAKDPNAAIESMIEYRRALLSYGKDLEHLHGQLASHEIEKLQQANATALDAVSEHSFALMPLRLRDIRPDDTSGKTWIGDPEQIAFALYDAKRAGISVTVEEHDVAARIWRVTYNTEHLTILETKNDARPRTAKATITDKDRDHARRYAEAAKFMLEQWEARSQQLLDARFDSGEIVEFAHVQAGFAQSGVINQATRFSANDTRLVIHDGSGGALAGRGDQELGQAPSFWDSPGLRASEQATPGVENLEASALGRAIDIGKIESQVLALRGRVASKIELRAESAVADWGAKRKFRITVETEKGPRRIYTDEVDVTIGPGPGDVKQVSKVVADENTMWAMFASHQLLSGEDPDIASKLLGNILVWGGTPTGAWDAELAAARGHDVAVMGDDRNDPERKATWPEVMDKYREVLAKISAGDSSQETLQSKAKLETSIRAAHKGQLLRRNTRPGATYGDGSKVRMEFGTPTKIVPLEGGGVEVTFGDGALAKKTKFDQVIIAHGQDPGAPGGPGSLLGPGAKETGRDGRKRKYGAVPEGTIKLKPIFVRNANQQQETLVGFESVEPAGIRLLGASGISEKILPWVDEAYRERVELAFSRMNERLAPTRDFGPISDDSTGVTTGIEHQRDKLPRANEVQTAHTYRLPGPDKTLELDPNDRANWNETVREFLAVNMRADERWVRVEQLGGGRSGAILYKVWIDTTEVGVFKIFSGNQAVEEQHMLRLLDAAKLTKLKAVRERGTLSVDPSSGYKSAILMDTAKGESLAKMIDKLPTDAKLREQALEQLGRSLQNVAEGLAEFHESFSAHKEMTLEAKHADVDYVLEQSFKEGGRDAAATRIALGEDYERVAALIEKNVVAPFFDASVAATAYHGDANLGNFIVDKKTVSVIDVESMRWSIDDKGHGTKSGAADVARITEALAMTKLSPQEVRMLTSAFTDAYLKNPAVPLGAGFVAARRWYAVQFELSILAKGDRSAKSRLMSLVEEPKR